MWNRRVLIVTYNDMPGENSIHFECPHCSQSLEGEVEMANSEISCPQCQEMILVPDCGPTAAPSPLPSPNLRAIDICPIDQRKFFIITTTGNEVSGQAIEKYLGIVRGIVVRGATSSQQLFGTFKQNWVGGDIESYITLCDNARRDAFMRMLTHADSLKADAIIGFRYDTTEFTPGVTEVLAYGTAVKLAAA